MFVGSAGSRSNDGGLRGGGVHHFRLSSLWWIWFGFEGWLSLCVECRLALGLDISESLCVAMNCCVLWARIPILRVWVVDWNCCLFIPQFGLRLVLFWYKTYASWSSGSGKIFGLLRARFVWLERVSKLVVFWTWVVVREPIRVCGDSPNMFFFCYLVSRLYAASLGSACVMWIFVLKSL